MLKTLFMAGLLLGSLPASAAEELRVVKTLPLLEENVLGRWKVAPYAHEGDVDVRDGVLSIGLGDYLSGVVWKEKPPARTNYEIELEARAGFGSDFLLGLTVPVGDSYCTWINGGWGNRIVGLSDIDGKSADDNETTTEMAFKKERWYKFKIRVLDEHIQCWIDGKSVIDVDIKGKRISLRRGKIQQSIPLGISTYDTEGEFRKITWRTLERRARQAGPEAPSTEHESGASSDG
jgi:hypothetical protein